MRTYFNGRIGNWRYVIDLDDKRLKIWYEKPPVRRERSGKPCMTPAAWATVMNMTDWARVPEEEGGNTWDWRKVMSVLEQEDKCEP